MTRNIENRLEVAVPIYNKELQKEIIDVFEICWSDNVKARKINGAVQNEFVKNNHESVRSQWKILEYYQKKAAHED